MQGNLQSFVLRWWWNRSVWVDGGE